MLLTLVNQTQISFYILAAPAFCCSHLELLSVPCMGKGLFPPQGFGICFFPPARVSCPQMAVCPPPPSHHSGFNLNITSPEMPFLHTLATVFILSCLSLSAVLPCAFLLYSLTYPHLFTSLFIVHLPPPNSVRALDK